MINRHAHNTAVSVRVDREVRDTAKEALEARDWTIAEFIATCLHAVGENPDRVIRTISRHRVERPKGRPKREDSGESS